MRSRGGDESAGKSNDPGGGEERDDGEFWYRFVARSQISIDPELEEKELLLGRGTGAWPGKSIDS